MTTLLSSPSEAGLDVGGVGASLTLEAFQRLLEPRLLSWLAQKEKAALEESPDLGELTSRLHEFVARGGKRLRPALVFFAYRGCGGANEDAALDLAMSTELLHTYLLIHDDIMDHAAVRRGEPSAHLLFEAQHRARGWRGSSEQHGESVAILLGDLAHSYAVELFMRAHSEIDRPALGEIFTAMCQEVVRGQYLEMTAPYRTGWNKDDLLAVLRLKSGRYSVERPLELGATAAGASAETVSRLGVYGEALGEAFQLKDDLLGVFGVTDTVGKSVDSDIAEGKFTVLVQQALERSGEADRAVLEAALGDSNISLETLARVRDIVTSSGASTEVESMIERRLTRATEALSEIEISLDARTMFSDLVDFLRDRDH